MAFMSNKYRMKVTVQFDVGVLLLLKQMRYTRMGEGRG